VYAPIRTGTDIVFLGAVVAYLLANDKIQHEYVKNYTDFTFIVREDFTFDEGIYSGYDPQTRKYDKHTWDYEMGADGFVKTDPTLEHPRCVYQLMKQHYARYTPEMVERGLRNTEGKVSADRRDDGFDVNAYAGDDDHVCAGWTQHSIGSQMIRQGAMVQLLLGNIGVSGGGMNALRGHPTSRADGPGPDDAAAAGYINLPVDSEQTWDQFIAARASKPLRPNQLSYWQNADKFMVSLMRPGGRCRHGREPLGL